MRYGIPADVVDDLARDVVVIANVSRTIIADAAQRYMTRVIEITAPPDVLAARLAARGRETAADSVARLARNVPLPTSGEAITIMNDGPLAESVERFVTALRHCLPG